MTVKPLVRCGVLLMNTGIAEARAKAVEILDKFAKFGVEAAKRGK